MPNYNYRARNKKGEILTGLVEASTLEAAEKTISAHGLVVMDIELPRTWRDLLKIGSKIKVRSKSFFTRQLATMVNAGLPLPQVLSLLSRSEKNRYLKAAIIRIQEDLEAGYSFSTSISKHPEIFSNVFVNAVRAGEATGKLEIVLVQLADSLERDSAASSRFRAVMIYPIFVLSAMVIVGAIMMVRVVPVLSGIFAESKQELPIATRLLISVSNLITHYWWLLLVLLFFLFVGLRAYGRTGRGRRMMDRLRLRLPILKNVSLIFYMARFTRTLGMLVNAGVPLLEAIQITSDAMDNLIYKEALERASIQVERGVTLSLALSKSELFPPLVSQMVLVGEQTGELDKTLQKISATYEEEYDTLIKGAATLIEPLIIILLALGVAFMVFAILIPIYQISLLQ